MTKLIKEIEIWQKTTANIDSDNHPALNYILNKVWFEKKNYGSTLKIGRVRAIFVQMVNNSGLWLYRKIFSKFIPSDFEAL